MRRGFTLIASTIITAVLLLTGSYFVSTSLTDLRIAGSQESTTRAYYLGESAIALLAHALQNTTALRDAFLNGTLTESNSTLTRSSVFQTGDALNAYAISSAPGEATIFAEGSLPLGSTRITRRIENQITRALGGAVTDYAMLTGGNNEDLRLQYNMTINGGIIFGNDDIELASNAQVTVNQGQVWAHDEIKTPSGTSLHVVGGSTAQNIPALPMPAIDFDSSHPTSWRSQATQIMTTGQFNALPSGSTLSGIIFVEGSPAHLRKNLTVNGLLIINGSFEIESPTLLTINAGTGPSGLLVKSNLEIESSVTIQGLLYSANYLEIEYDDDDTQGTMNVSITGGIVGRQMIIRREKPNPLNVTITHDAALIGRVLNTDVNTTAPLIDIGHWEEEY